MSEQAETAELLSCPLCQGHVQFRKALWPSDGCTDAIIHVAPSTCGMSQFEDGSIDESIITKWNTRAPAHPAPAASEPVAWRIAPDDVLFLRGTTISDDPKFAEGWRKAGCVVEPLYPAQPQAVAPITTEQLDKLQFGRSLHERPVTQSSPPAVNAPHNSGERLPSSDAAEAGGEAIFAECAEIAEGHVGNAGKTGDRMGND